MDVGMEGAKLASPNWVATKAKSGAMGKQREGLFGALSS